MDERYFWIRVFDYVYERDSNYDSESLSFGKGVLLDEFYLKGENIDRESVKQEVKSRYVGKTASTISFAKPKNKDGIYAIVMDSSKYFYDRFYLEIDTFCFWHTCHKQIIGKMTDFPKVTLENGEYIFFCSYDCKSHYYNAISPTSEGEFQEKEEGCNGSVFGYIYLIYNRLENQYYVGQTRYMPFFRWQEHIKAGGKGDIKDLVFSVLTEVTRHTGITDEQNQQYLNCIEAWWIAKYQEEGHKVFNISNPKITITYLRDRFDEMIKRNKQLNLFNA